MGGWNAAAYLGGEIKKPERNIPLALFTGTALVVCLYLLLNIVCIYALSPGEMSGVLEVGARSAFLCLAIISADISAALLPWAFYRF
jgi:APA family basic amino acid/polyamine antiporter